LGGIAIYNKGGVIRKCEVVADASWINVSNADVGGIVSKNSGSTALISECMYKGSVKLTHTPKINSGIWFGGIAAQSVHEELNGIGAPKIERSIAIVDSVSLLSYNSVRAGGIVASLGDFYRTEDYNSDLLEYAEIVDCYAKINVVQTEITTGESRVGGIAGSADRAKINNSHSLNF
jgi:hypothetical protein